jgi:hypothetical protein
MSLVKSMLVVTPPPEVFGDNQDLALKAELKVATIIHISKHDNGSSFSAFFTQDILHHHAHDCYGWQPTAPTSVMKLTPALREMHKQFPPPLNFSHLHCSMTNLCSIARVLLINNVCTDMICTPAATAVLLITHCTKRTTLMEECLIWILVGVVYLFPNDCFHHIIMCTHIDDTQVCTWTLYYLREKAKCR